MPHDIRAIDSLTPAFLQAALNCMPSGLVLVDRDGQVQLANEQAVRLLGLARPGHKGKLARVLGRSHALDPGMRRALAGAVRQAMRSGAGQMSLSLQPEDALPCLSVDLRSAGKLGWVISLEDVTATRLAQDWLIEHASTDLPTGRANRQHFLLMLRDVIDAAAANAAGPAVVVVQIRKLKTVNDAFGASAGDLLLRLAADRIAECLQEGDLLARCTGNEFCLALVSAKGAADIAARVECIRARLDTPFLLDEHAVQPGLRFGIAVADAGTDVSAEDLLTQASLAVAFVRDSAVRPVAFFTTAMTEHAQWRCAIEADLRGALQRREFALHYQPQVEIGGRTVTGFEALIRWVSPSRGRVSPAEFIPIAEDLGLIVDIGKWVLQAACTEAVGWPGDISVAVNASALQFEAGDYAETVGEVLAQTGLPPHRLEIEITESFLLRETGAVVQTLADLRTRGVRVVVDDFGTGFASLSQLTRFQFDKIKIDRSFVSADLGSSRNDAIVRSVAALAHSLGVPSTAEGVETQGQWDQMKADGCTSVQGYFLSPPVPADEVSEVLSRLRPAALAAA